MDESPHNKELMNVHHLGLDIEDDNMSVGSIESDIESLYISESEEREQEDSDLKLMIAIAKRQARKKNKPWNLDYETALIFQSSWNVLDYESEIIFQSSSSQTESDDSATTSDMDEAEQPKFITSTTTTKRDESLSSCKNYASSEAEHTSLTCSETQSNTSAEEEDEEYSTASSNGSKHVRFSLVSAGSEQGEVGVLDACQEHSFRSLSEASNDQKDEHTRAMETLFKLLTSKSNDHAPENRQAALRMGAPLAVVKVMRSNKRHETVQKYACRCLAAIAWNAESVDQVLEVGGLETSLYAFYRFRDNTVIQRAICKLIGNLWMFRKQNNTSSSSTSPNKNSKTSESSGSSSSSCTNSTRRQRVVNAGGLKAVILAMKSHPQNTDVQRWACYALQSLVRKGSSSGSHSTTSTSSSFVRSAVKAGGIKLVILAMMNHLGDDDGSSGGGARAASAAGASGCKELQLDACRFLHHVVKYGSIDGGKKYRDKIVQAKGLVAIGEALRVHGKDENVRKMVRRSMKVLVGIP
jgi:hypothetical protein